MQENNTLKILVIGSRRIGKILSILDPTKVDYVLMKSYGGAHRRILTALRVIRETPRNNVLLTDVTHFWLLFLVIVGKMTGKKVILRLRGSFHSENEVRHGKWLNTLDIYSVKQVNAIIAVSDWLRNDVVKLGVSSEKVYVVNTPMSLPFPDMCSQKVSGNVLLFVTNFYFAEKVSELSEVCAAVCDRVDDVRIEIVGEGDYRDEISKTLSKQVEDGKVQFLGLVNTTEITQIYSRASVFCHVSNLDAFPSVVQEAMAHAVATVVANVGGAREMVAHGESGYLCNESCLLIDRVVELLENPSKAIEFGIKGYDIARDRWNSKDLAVQMSECLVGFDNEIVL